MAITPSNWEPEGALVSSIPAIAPSIDGPNAILKGTHVTLTPLTTSHFEELYTHVGGLENGHLYKYLPGGPFATFPSFVEHMERLTSRTVFFPYTILSHSLHSEDRDIGSAVGIICLMNIVPAHRSIEIGHVLFSPLLQRTTAATEAIYLLMKHAFEDLHYLRVEWKTNSFNEPSKRAALRLGFVYEGTFRAHMVIKGRRRDTDWFSVVEEEWGLVGKALGEWLRDGNFDGEGRQRRKLEEIRGELVKGNVGV